MYFGHIVADFVACCIIQFALSALLLYYSHIVACHLSTGFFYCYVSVTVLKCHIYLVIAMVRMLVWVSESCSIQVFVYGYVNHTNYCFR